MDRIREAAMMRRSPLYLWMLQNHGVFGETVAEAVRPNWKALAEAFGAEGLTDADGKPPTPEGTRQTWWKVRKTVKARQAAAARRQGGISPQPPPQAAPLPDLLTPEAEPGPEFRFDDLKPAVPRKFVPKADKEAK
jgi:hypothetical protein